MSDEKITISMDEVNHATPVPGATPPPIFTSGYVPPESDQDVTPKRTGLFIGIGIAAVALLCITGIGIMAIIDRGGSQNRGGSQIRIFPQERTVSDYRAEKIERVKVELSKPDSKWKKLIEDAHLTVTVKSTRIVRCDVKTVDGSDKVGKDNSNIDKVSMVIRFNWQGQVFGPGYSDLQIEYDGQNDKVLTSKIVETSAKITIDDDLLFELACAICAALAL